MRVFALVAATITTGLTSGLFYTYASATPGLRSADSLAVAQVMQRLNVAVLNGWYLLGFVGTLVFTGVAVVLHLPSEGHRVLPAAVGALVCYTGALVVTRVLNLPLSQALAEAGEPGLAGYAERCAPSGAQRVRWNAVRALLSTGALGFLCWALVLHCQTIPN
ncbi:anthrone oxygenase family protein [Kitasatospora sp. NPDC002551]|uniref:anthrone oxygenase family protein n=1 Tax=unclassified Kitasatospora TaxID=2633591 RepID=UPI003329F35F